MSINTIRSNQANSLSNPVNAAHFSDVKARIELAVRQKAPKIPGTASDNSHAVMPGTAQGASHGPGRLLNAYA